MTATETEAPIIQPGQTWAVCGYTGLRDEVIRLIPVDDDMYVLYRGPGTRPQIELLADFLINHDTPQWTVPRPKVDQQYGIAFVDSDYDAGYYIGRQFADVEAASTYAANDGREQIGLVLITTTTTYEWAVSTPEVNA